MKFRTKLYVATGTVFYLIVLYGVIYKGWIECFDDGKEETLLEAIKQVMVMFWVIINFIIGGIVWVKLISFVTDKLCAIHKKLGEIED